MDKTGKVNFLNARIKELEKEKEEIQQNCRHLNTYLKFTDNVSEIREYCSECGKKIGIPSSKSIELFLSGK